MTRTVTIALIGNDGSGKSSVANLLLEKSEMNLKYVYMGVSIESSNYALPWSRLANEIKKRNARKKAAKEGITDPTYVTTHHMDHRRRKTSTLRTIFRVVNRLTEGTYRLLITAIFRMRGYNVLFDRYFLYEAAPSLEDDGKPGEMHPVEAAYYRFWRDIVPKPDLTIFLDGPPEILLARKGEGDVEYFNNRRGAWLYVGQQIDNFHVVDATQALEDVYQEVSEIIGTAIQ